MGKSFNDLYKGRLMKVQLICSQIATINFNQLEITKEDFDKLDWLEASRILEIHADVESTEVNDWVFIKED